MTGYRQAARFAIALLISAAIVALLAPTNGLAEEAFGKWRIELHVGGVDPGDSLEPLAARCADGAGEVERALAERHDAALGELDGDLRERLGTIDALRERADRARVAECIAFIESSKRGIVHGRGDARRGTG